MTLNRLIVNFCHLNEHKFRHNFTDTLNSLCPSSLEIESTAHFFYTAQTIRITVDKYNDIDNYIISRKPSKLLRIIFYDDCKFKDNVSK